MHPVRHVPVPSTHRGVSDLPLASSPQDTSLNAEQTFRGRRIKPHTDIKDKDIISCLLLLKIQMCRVQNARAASPAGVLSSREGLSGAMRGSSVSSESIQAAPEMGLKWMGTCWMHSLASEGGHPHRISWQNITLLQDQPLTSAERCSGTIQPPLYKSELFANNCTQLFLPGIAVSC